MGEHIDFGRFGIWSGYFRRPDAAVPEAAAQVEALGFTGLWVPGGMGGDLFADVERVLQATDHIPVATAVLNVWMHEPADVAEATARLNATYPGRFLLGLGISHEPAIDRLGKKYARPLATMVEYLDALDAAATPVAPAERILAALGPKMLELARQRCAGAHPYFVPPEHTAVARAALGDDALLAVEQMVVLEADESTARAIARQGVNIYLGLPNYTSNLIRLGTITEDDLADGGSDRLVDAIVAWGDDAAIRRRLDEHLAAGADHVCVQVLTADPKESPTGQWPRLAEVVA